MEFLLTRPSRDVTKSERYNSLFSVISTHTSLAGRDNTSIRQRSEDVRFLLTRPSRDVTLSQSILLLWMQFLLTRPSRDVTLNSGYLGLSLYISTHTSLAGRDSFSFAASPRGHQFLLTRPSRDVTPQPHVHLTPIQISTHTSLAGRDCVWLPRKGGGADFYSHVPRGT